MTASGQRKAQEIVGDYRAIGLTHGRHPIALLRPVPMKMRDLPAEVRNTFADRQIARGCSIVTERQRREAANGVVCVTMEDETGPVNVIVWHYLVGRRLVDVCACRVSWIRVAGIFAEPDGAAIALSRRTAIDTSLAE